MPENCLLEELTWKDARSLMSKANPGFTKVIDQLSPNNELSLYKIRYPFGVDILKNGVFHLPNGKNEIVSITDPSISNKLRENLGYNNNSVPLMISIHNRMEPYDDIGSRIIPVRVISEGKIFAIRPTLDTLTNAESYIIPSTWCVSAGAKSLVMLPKITDEQGYSRLKQEFCIDELLPPQSLRDHGRLFTKLAQCSNFPDQTWYVEVICFSKKWFTHSKSLGWVNFYCFLLESGWVGTQYWRTQEQWDTFFSYMQSVKNLRPDPYLADTVKHLVTMGLGEVPTFSVALGNEMGPINAFEKIFREIYQLKEYPPVIMQPSNFDRNQPGCIGYYSLIHPTAKEFSPKSKNAANKLRDLLELKHIHRSYVSTAMNGQIDISRTPVYDFLTKVQVDFFHSEEDRNKEVKYLQELFESDPAMLDVYKRNNKSAFCYSSPFLRGCIRLLVPCT